MPHRAPLAGGGLAIPDQPRERLQVIPLPNGSFAENCYLVYHPGSPETVLVDPGEEAERFLAEAARHGRRVTAIWLTHAHLDHIAGVSAVHRATGATIHLHPADRPLYDGLPEQGRWFGLELEPPPPAEVMLHHGQRLGIGDTVFEVRHLPGHSPGHVCFIGGGVVLGGDVLFEGSIGRTDLPGGDLEVLLGGIRRELLVLPDPTIVYPGHGPPTTIGREREGNPFLQGR